MNSVLEFYIKMKDLMSGGLAKLGQNANKTFNQIQDGINKTVDSTKRLNDSFDKVGNKAMSVGSIIKGNLGAEAIKRVLGSTIDFVGGAISKAMEFGTTKKSFEVLTGDKGKGQALAGDLNKLQQDTILGPSVFKNAQTMLGFGIATEKVLPNLKMLGDISMGDANKLDSLTLAFSQVQAGGKLTGQDLIQFINAGFNPLNEISKATGVSMGDLKKKMEQGSISAAMIEQAFKSATGEGGLFHNMLNELANTPAGKLAQLQGQFESFKVKLGEALMPLAEIGLKALQKLLDLATQVLPYIVQGVQFIAGSINSLLGPTSEWAGWINTVKDLFTNVWWYVQYIGQRVFSIVGGVLQWVAKSQILQDVFSGLVSLVNYVYQAVAGVVDVLAFTWENILKPILDAIEWVYGKVKSLLGFGGSEMVVTSAGKLEIVKPGNDAHKATALDAGKAANAFAGLTSGGSKSESGSGDVAKGITGGGPRVVNISIGKLVEKIEMHVGSTQEGIDGIESKVEEVLLRILNSGALVQ